MSDFAETFAQIEHVEFIANAVGAEDAEEFFALTRPRPPVQMLLSARDPASLVARIRRLIQQPASKNYIHPMDAPIAVYLDVIYRIGAVDALRAAWGLVRGNETLYWTNQVAASINTREQAAAALDSATSDASLSPGQAAPETEASVLPRVPEPVNREQMAKLLYAAYMAASKAEIEAGGKSFPPRPLWDDLDPDHTFRRIFHQTADVVLSKLAVVPFVPAPPEDSAQQQAVAHAIRTGLITARLTLAAV